MSISMLDNREVGNQQRLPTESLSNRANHTPVFDHPVVVGIDTIRVRGRYISHDLEVVNTRSRRDRDSGEWTLCSTSGHQVLSHLPVTISTDDRIDEFVAFEMSIPNILRGTNEVASSATEVAAAVEFVYSAASEVVRWDTDWPDLEVTRCDLVRDFLSVNEIPAVLDRLAAVPQVKGRVRARYNDPIRGHAQTYRVGTPGRWMLTAYDKGQEMLAGTRKIKDLARRDVQRERALQAQARGHLRVEIGVRAAPLKERLHTNRLHDLLDEDLMNQTGKHYFDAVGLGTPVGGTAKIIDTLKAIAKTPKEYKKVDRLIGVLFLEAIGLDQPASRNTINEYQKLAARYALTAADFKMEDRPTVRLDWQTGTLIEDESAA